MPYQMDRTSFWGIGWRLPVLITAFLQVPPMSASPQILNWFFFFLAQMCFVLGPPSHHWSPTLGETSGSLFSALHQPQAYSRSIDAYWS